MSYTDLRDFAPEFTVTGEHSVNDVPLSLAIEKLGGGTLGESYRGTWRYRVAFLDGTVLTQGQDLETPIPHTHADAIELLAEFIEDGFTCEGHESLKGEFMGQEVYCDGTCRR